MKRFMLFAFKECYPHGPHGGMNDFVDSFDTIAEAKNNLRALSTYDRYQIYDIEEDCTVEDCAI
ncbi:MAG: hypothetical protein WC346_02225 [Methanogenium sp.]|jgi:hypothetical protein